MTEPGRPAPRVTITDPRAPAAPVDVLGDDGQPWRPPPWSLKAVALAVALTAAAVVPAKVVQAREQDRRAAAAAADAVLLSFGPGRFAPRLDLTVSNDGPTPVRLVDVRVDGPGYRPVPLSARVTRRDTADLALVDTRTCGEDLLDPAAAVTSAEVRARTADGLLVQRTVRLPDDTRTALLAAAQRRCGYLAPADALAPTVRTVGAGADLALQLGLHNASRATLELAFVGLPAAGVTPRLQRPLPLLLPPNATLTLPVALTVDSCPSARASYLASPLDASAPLLQLQVSAVLAGGSRRGDPVDVAVSSPTAADPLPAYVLARCGRPRPGDQVAG